MPRTLTSEQIAQIRELRYGDGLTQRRVAEIVGCHPLTVRSYAPGYPGKVSNAAVREMFLASGISAGELARRLGWLDERKRSSGDSSRAKRILGLASDVRGTGLRSTRAMIDAETAERIAEALGHERWEATA